MKKLVCLVALTIFIITVLTACKYTVPSHDEKFNNGQPNVQAVKKNVITTWGWYEDSFKACFSEFNKVYPDVKLEYVSVSPVTGEYMQKVQLTIASGNRLPDILWGERSSGLRGVLFDYDIWEDLRKPPYNVDINNFFEYTSQLITNSKGQICGLEWELDIAGIAYRRDLAKKYIGTDDPEELESMLRDWEAFISVGKTVFEKSKGKVTMLSGLRDAYNILIDQNAESIVVNDSIKTDGILKDTFQMLCRMRDADILGKYETWTPSWMLSFKEGSVIFYPCATWSADLVIKPNYIDGSGNWRLIVPPSGGFVHGGTTFGITKDSKNKAVSWQFLNWFLNSEEGARVNKKMGNHLVPLKSMYNDPGFISQKSEYFAGQDIGKVWLEKIAPGVKSRAITKYDQVIMDTSAIVMRAMLLDRKMGIEDAMSMWKEAAHVKKPSLTIK